MTSLQRFLFDMNFDDILLEFFWTSLGNHFLMVEKTLDILFNSMFKCNNQGLYLRFSEKSNKKNIYVLICLNCWHPNYGSFGKTRKLAPQWVLCWNSENCHDALEWLHNEHDGVYKSPTLRLFTQPFIQMQIKENIRALRHWPLRGEFTGDRWIPRRKGQ